MSADPIATREPETGVPAAARVHSAGSGFAITALVLGVIGTILGFIPLLALFALILGAVGVIFGLFGWTIARKAKSGKLISSLGVILSLIAIGLSLAGFRIVSTATTDLIESLQSAGAANPPSVVAPGTSDTPPAPTSQPPASPRPTYTPIGTYDIGAQTGSTLQVRTFNATGEYSITNWIRAAKPANPYIRPMDGHRWAAFKVLIRNTGEQPLPFNPMGFILVDKDSQRYISGNAIGQITAGPLLSAGQLDPGEETTGYVVTEVPLEASIFELKMDNAYGGGSWALK